MSQIRWLKISEALAALGHEVDIATNEPHWFVRSTPIVMGPRLRRVPIAGLQWTRYDVVKTLFGKGYEALEQYGGDSHPFIISKLGSVVGAEDMPGVYFYGAAREQMFATQRRIQEHSRFVTVVSPPGRQLWGDCFGTTSNVLVVPGAADDEIPPAGRDPYPVRQSFRALFAGTIYNRRSQPEANRTIVAKLNEVGRVLAKAGGHLYLIGDGDVSEIDRRAVTYLGTVLYTRAWDYLRYADVGVVVSAGPFMHNNESSKIYHYLRAGLPVVTESGFPNDHVVRESQCGIVVEGHDLKALAEMVGQVARTPWNREHAIRYIRANHTWGHRAKVYDEILRPLQ
jgi:glycosyltransferase involved in cell wall biosynthesis